MTTLERFAFVDKAERDKKAAKEAKKKKKDKKKSTSGQVEKPPPLYEVFDSDNQAVESLVSVDSESDASSKNCSRPSTASTSGTESGLSSFQTFSTTDRGSSVPIPTQLESHFVGVHKEHVGITLYAI